MLAPHHGEDAEFGVGGLAAENGDDLLVLVRRELMLRDDVGSDRCHVSFAPPARTSELRITSPSVEPISGSAARSGCGIMPSTLRSRFRMPAMSRSEPLGLSI